jgi:hypothetical protein
MVVEYYERDGLATAKLSWTKVSEPLQMWQGEYFNNTTVSGRPVLVRYDGAIDFNWGSQSPAPGVVQPDRFSVRWTQSLDLPSGRYRFVMTVDDGGRLWVNDHLLIEAWREQPATMYVGDIYLPGGPTPVRMEYYENGGVASAHLSWIGIDAPSSPRAVIVDDTHLGFVRGGDTAGWRTSLEGYGGQLTWTWNNEREQPNYNWARWHPDLVSGLYEVQVYIPHRYATTSNARYWVVHADGSTLKSVDQSANGGHWLSLGIYQFDGLQNHYVSLSDLTFEPGHAARIAFDAVRWLPR